MEMQRRWVRVRFQLEALVDKIKDVRLRANEKEMPKTLKPVEKSKLIEGLFETIRSDLPEGANESIAKRMAKKIGDYFLWRRETTTPVIHELLVLAPWWVAEHIR